MTQVTAEDSGTVVTADQVAERAGVSRWTVARAFKKDASISSAARARVLQAAEALGAVRLHAAGGADAAHAETSARASVEMAGSQMARRFMLSSRYATGLSPGFASDG